MNTSRMTPSIVGIICHKRLMMYAVIGLPPPRARRTGSVRGSRPASRAASPRRGPGHPQAGSLPGGCRIVLPSLLVFLSPAGPDDGARANRGDVDILPLRVQDRVLLVAQHPRLRQLVA